MRNLTYPIALSFAALSIHAGVPVGAGWTNVSNGLTGSFLGVGQLVIDRATRNQALLACFRRPLREHR
jgi:hypothetical protein